MKMKKLLAVALKIFVSLILLCMFILQQDFQENKETVKLTQSSSVGNIKLYKCFTCRSMNRTPYIDMKYIKMEMLYALKMSHSNDLYTVSSFNTSNSRYI